LLAAGVENPTLIAQWRREPHRLAQLGVDPASFDLPALWKFAGLTIKVRHNGVRQQLPCTFRLMAIAGLEIGLFADYAAHRRTLAQPYAPGTAQRMDDLVQFITSWITPSDPAHAFLGDIARHEHALVCLGAPAPGLRDGVERDVTAVALRPSAVPRIRGRIALHEMHCDPLRLAATLRQTAPSLRDVPLESRYYGYWRGDSQSDISVLELDALGFYAVSLADGRRSVADLSQALVGRRRPARRFMESLSQLEGLGLLAFAPARRMDAA
jgi:hypothetical protein